MKESYVFLHVTEEHDQDGISTERHSGLTKREFFAAMAMQGILSDIDKYDAWDAREVAADAVLYADELIKALRKK